VGEEKAGIICERCGVKIVADSAKVRQKRMGHAALACPVCHPFDGSLLLETFPVVPIHRRRNAEGWVSSLGRRYEVLVEANLRTADALPARDGSDSLAAVCDFRPTELQDAIAALIGTHTKETPPFGADDLLSLVAQAFDNKDPDVVELICCCALMLRVEPTT
jgi:hypothetical protein